MKRLLSRAVLSLVFVGAISSAALAAPIPMGYFSWDLWDPGVSGQFDIINQTGVNSTIFPDPTWPVSSTVQFTNFQLVVTFSDSSVATYAGNPGADFTPNFDGQSWDGLPIPNGPGDPVPVTATLSGFFDVFVDLTLNDGSLVTVLNTFSNTISFREGGLLDGDHAIIYATPVGEGSPVPEPTSLFLLGSGVVGLVRMRNRRKTSPVQ